jgi:hypothetical protein
MYIVYNLTTGIITSKIYCGIDTYIPHTYDGEGYMVADSVPDEANAIIDGEFTTVYIPPLEPPSKLIMHGIRAERNSLMQQCDWTQVYDSPLSPEKTAEWSAYRQALRDFPDKVDLSNIVWPTPPGK